MKQRVLAILCVFVLLLTSCGQNAVSTWQEQYDLGVRYLSEGKYEEAIIAFTAAIEIEPKRVEAYVGRGDAYLGLGETEANLAAARADYETALDLAPDDLMIYFKLSNAHKNLETWITL